MKLQQGFLLNGGSYRIESVLGQGGFGITYKAVQVALNRTVAIKEFYVDDYCERDVSGFVSVPSTGGKKRVDEYLKKFIKEAKHIALLEHKHIVPLIDIFEENGTAYYVMKYYGNGSLFDKINRCGPLPEETSLRYIRQLSSALKYVHSRKIMHLDIKPGNIMLDDDDNAILIDFGLSKHYDGSGHQTTRSVPGTSKGYAPLEQYKDGGVGYFSPSTDIYSLAATLYKILTGITPPEASDLMNSGLPEFSVDVSPDIRNAIKVAMSPKQEGRPQSVDEFLSMLEGKSGKLSHEENKGISFVTANEKDVNLVDDNEFGSCECQLPLAKRIELLRKYETIGDYNYDRARVYRESKNFTLSGGRFVRECKYGFIDKVGEEVIPCIYDYVYDFKEELAAVEIGNKWGFVDRKGNNIIPCKYDEVSCFSEKRAAVKLNGKWGIIDTEGRVKTPFVYDLALSPVEGLSVVACADEIDLDGSIRLHKLRLYKYGYVNREGKEVIPCKYNQASFFSQGLAAVSVNHKYGYIDKSGKEVIPFIYESAGPFSENIASVCAGGLYGYIDKSGATVIPFKYSDGYGFVEGLAQVGLDGFGCIDRNGKELVPCIYDQVFSFVNGFAIAELNDKFGFVDKKGNLIVSCKFDCADHFYNGKAFVYYGSPENADCVVGFVDSTGTEFMADGEYSAVFCCKEFGLVKAVEVGGCVSMFDTDAKLVYCDRDIFPQANINEETRPIKNNVDPNIDDNIEEEKDNVFRRIINRINPGMRFLLIILLGLFLIPIILTKIQDIQNEQRIEAARTLELERINEMISIPRNTKGFLCIECYDKNSGAVVYFSGTEWESISYEDRAMFEQIGVSILQDDCEFIMASIDCKDSFDGDRGFHFGGYDMEWDKGYNIKLHKDEPIEFVTTGYNDTKEIIEQFSGLVDKNGVTGAPAAEAAWGYKANSYDTHQWYLPSYSELSIIVNNREEINYFLYRYFNNYGRITDYRYASSTLSTFRNTCWSIYVGNSTIAQLPNDSYRVRPVAEAKNQ